MFSTLEVSRLTGAGMRQLQWWDEQQIIIPKRVKGGFRSYSREQLNEVEYVLDFRRYGVNLHKIRDLMAGYRSKTLSLARVRSSLQVLDSVGIKL